MIKTVLLAAAAATAMVATPAYAQDANDAFVGPRVELEAGTENIRGLPSLDDVTYGAAVGIDIPVGKRITVGPDISVTNVFDADEGRVYDIGARAGYAVTDNALVYIRAGYQHLDFDLGNTNIRTDADGYSIGGGVEIALTDDFYLAPEYRYSNLDQGLERQSVLLGVGLRF